MKAEKPQAQQSIGKYPVIREIGSGAAEQDNRTYRSRADADLPPYPALPATTP